MCGRYYIAEEDSGAELEKIIAQLNRRSDASTVKTGGEIFPSDTAPVIANSKSLVPSAFPMAWGYHLSGGKLIINARSETASERPMFADGMENRRCLIPASNYFEWAHSGEKTKFAIAPKGKSFFYMAGIYRLESGKPVFSILTRAAAPGIASIHDRMPVIIPDAAVGDWLNIRFRADDVLRDAMTDMDYRQAEQA